jgi:O-acetylhomoserine/O-acetylserine sulfhydrylase-like pyridoxal-dependent enzyme
LNEEVESCIGSSSRTAQRQKVVSPHRLNRKTKLIFVETIGNPRMDVPDIPAIAEIAHKANIPLLTEALTITLSFAKIASSY